MRKGWVFLVLVLFGAPLVADEIIYFKSGSSMAIREHAIKDDMIQVDLGDNGFMSFPMESVDRIEDADRDVGVKPSASSNNKMFKSRPRPGGPKTQTGRRPANRGVVTATERARQARQEGGSNIVRGSDGLTGFAPLAHGTTPSKRKLRAVGNQAAIAGSTANGKTRGADGRMVLDGRQLPARSDGRTIPTPVRAELRAAPPPPPPADGESEKE